MIFITVGSQKFQFNRLLKKIDQLIDMNLIKEEVFAQIGVSDYVPKNFKFSTYLNRDTYQQQIENCNLVITHGGTGAIIKAVKSEKKVIAVPRLSEYGEHIDNHQLQILKQFEEMDIICACYDIERLDDAIETVKKENYQSYKSNTDLIISNIENFILNMKLNL